MTTTDPARPEPELTVGEAVRLALDHEQAGRLAEAAAYADAVLGAVPDHCEMQALMAVLLMRQGRPAAGLLARAVAGAGEDAPFFVLLGSLLRRAGRLERAAQAQERAVALDPALGAASFNLANARHAAGQAGAALRAFRQAARLLPRHPEPRRRLAELLLEAGEPAKALELLTGLLHEAPEATALRVGAGNAAAALGRPGQAAAHLRRALALQPDLAEGWTNLGAMLTGPDEPEAADDAVAALRRAVLLRPGFAPARLSLGEALARAAGDAAALPALRTALALRPDDRRSLDRLAASLFRAGEGQAAGVWLARLDRLDGRPPARYEALRILPPAEWSRQAGQPRRVVLPARPPALPEAYLTRVEEGLVHPGLSMVSTDGGALLLDGLHPWSRGSLELLSHVACHAAADDRLLVACRGEPRRIAEEAVLLGGDGNFGHGVLDWASKLCVLDRCIDDHPELAGLPVLVSTTLLPGVAALFALLGLDPGRMRPVDPAVPLSCRRLWLPSLTHRFQDMAPEHMAFLRGRIGRALGIDLDEPAGPERRLYLTRRGSVHRVLVNEEEVAAVLASHGFEPFVPDGLPLEEQIAVLASAEALAAPVGAGTAAVAFARRGTRVLELTHEHCVLPQFGRLCGLLGQPYRQLVGRAVRNRGGLSFDWDHHIPAAAVDAALRELLA
ncbi:glycosyltransferase 61 family protein [Azospirillum thermophilum]|uniref:Glycosyltransferase 61 catalytic domain-containing protein n=1 Tax=Azospirillum thermophilum TaxID=2202148 RepID=A0A2S2CPQ8_9PROT|nr:glycosyltransferase 61 family protein [Azospirillum thermophilum]AWK86466.1 hypothetical protein DEW08_09625 [Azospirillum thermophilum]